MPDPTPPNWSLWRFLWRAAIWMALAGVAWRFTLQANTAFTIWLTKLLHEAVLLPAPYLFCEARPLFWHAALFPPVVGLSLASYWLPWPSRLFRAAVGYVVYCCLTAITIAVHISPYLPETKMRLVATNTLVDANYLTFGLAIWVLAAGPWYAQAQRGRTDPRPPSEPRPSWLARLWRPIRHGWLTRLVLLTLGVSLVIPLFAMTGTRQGWAARREMGTALRKVPFFPHPSNILMDNITPAEQMERDRLTAEAIRKVRQVIDEDETDGFRASYVYYLAGHLFYSLRHPNDEIAQQLWKTGKAYILKSGQLRRGQP